MIRKPKGESPKFNRLEEVREAQRLSRAELAKILRTAVHEIFSLQPFTKKKALSS